MIVSELMNLLSKQEPNTDVYFIIDEDIFQYDIACIGKLSDKRKPKYETMYLIYESYVSYDCFYDYLWDEHDVDLNKLSDEQVKNLLKELKIETLTGLFITVIPN